MRLKPLENVLTEVEILRQNGVNSIFFTDANFIGNRRRAKELLLALAEYGKTTHYTINFSTEVSLDVAEDHELLELFQQANFTLLYIGIESPNVESLQETKKNQNLRFPLLRVAGKSVRKYTLSSNPFQFNRVQGNYAKFSTRCCGIPWG
jgi:radical SAM superfamily enzyme YgiQ (UPF0313 family)